MCGEKSEDSLIPLFQYLYSIVENAPFYQIQPFYHVSIFPSVIVTTTVQAIKTRATF